ncbi:MAG: hypothetical protein HZC24_14135 [Rhodocyclales bacterium]|nr:hypothetical protein [Rhodocyclales bacterium]
MGILTNLSGWLRPPQPDAATEQAIEQAIDRVDPRLRIVSGYKRKLAPAVRHALDYCDGLVQEIPGPIDIGIRAFGKDPLVHAFFAAPEDIGRMLGTSREVRKFVADPRNLAADDFFALIGMRRKEKTVLGLAQQGNLISEGVPQRLLYFADHTLRELATDPAATRGGLRTSSFESLAASFAVHLDALRREKTDMHTAWEQERAFARSLAAQAVVEADAHAHRRFELEAGLRAMASSLEPAHVLEALAAWLADPAPRLHLVSTAVAVDRLGVLSKPSPDDPDVQMLNFPELVGRDRRRWIVMLARIAREDAMRAQEESREANRYLII